MIDPKPININNHAQMNKLIRILCMLLIVSMPAMAQEQELGTENAPAMGDVPSTADSRCYWQQERPSAEEDFTAMPLRKGRGLSAFVSSRSSHLVPFFKKNNRTKHTNIEIQGF